MTSINAPRSLLNRRRVKFPLLLVYSLLTFVLLGSLLLGDRPIVQAAGNAGYQGPSYAGASGSPSGSKPESKLESSQPGIVADAGGVSSSRSPAAKDVGL